MNKKIFASTSSVNVANTVNQAGGKAYTLSDKAALAQFVVTGCLNDTFYATADNQLENIKNLAEKCDDTFLAQCAVYCHQEGKMKDAPALLLGILIGRRNHGLVSQVFNKVITTQKMLRNLVQIIRSGTLGYKSFGTNTKTLIKNWLAERSGDELFRGSVGQSPSLGDVVKLVHPKPESKTKEAFYGWLLGKEYAKRNLPGQVKLFEKFKAGETSEVPNVDFRMLTALELSEAQWTEIGRKMPWNALRMNINTLLRHNVFSDGEMVDLVATKLSDENEVRRNNVFPYQLMTAFQNIEPAVPIKIKVALQQAMEVATNNIPELNGDTVVLVDVSGSMQSPITGRRVGSTTKTTCVDVASLIAACIIRKNSNARVVTFDTSACEASLNPLDSVMTNATKLNRNGGGTDCGCALSYINSNNIKAKNVIMVSDNESWVQQNAGSLRGRTSMAREWEIFKNKNRGAKLVCLDIQPSATTQVMDNTSVMNVSGFSDQIFTVIADFFNGDRTNFVKEIESTEI